MHSFLKIAILFPPHSVLHFNEAISTFYLILEIIKIDRKVLDVTILRDILQLPSLKTPVNLVCSRVHCNNYVLV